MNTETSLPPLRVLERALHKTTEALVGELVSPTLQRPDWSALEWRVAQAASALQGISSLLAGALRWKGTDEWEVFLAEQKAHGLLRHKRIGQLLVALDSQARCAGIALVALKGSALLALDIYRPGERPMGDIDVLVRGEDVDAAGTVLRAMGYVDAFNTRRHGVFAPADARHATGFGEHIDNPIKIELHERIAEALPIAMTDITALEFPRQAHAGLNSYPSLAALMRHLLLHAAGNMRARALRFIQLHDIALLAHRMLDGDWDELFADAVEAHKPWWSLPALLMAARYHPGCIPPTVLAVASRQCPLWLRQISRRHRLADVSWSNICVRAFPGIEWSRSPRDVLGFMASRIWPSRVALEELKVAVTAMPSSARIPWYGQSQVVRIARWMISRPPRVQTLHSLRLALQPRFR